MKKWLVPSLAAALLAACSSDQISKSDVQDALEHSAKNSVCIPFSLNVEHRAPNEDVAQSQLGMPEVRLLKRLDNGKRANLAAIKQMEILTDAGIYHREKEERVGSGDEAVRYLVYKITQKGTDKFRAGVGELLMCIGSEKAEKVNYFTTPTPSNGVTVSQVSFEAKPQVERWAQKLLKDSPFYEGLKRTETRHATLVKTNKGWIDIMELRNN